jgi:hypothetical protein
MRETKRQQHTLVQHPESGQPRPVLGLEEEDLVASNGKCEEGKVALAFNE